MRAILTLVPALMLLGSSALGQEAPSSWEKLADDQSFETLIQSGFRDSGIAKRERLQQDETQAFCSNPAYANSKEALKQRQAIEAANLATVKWPSDGVWLGDFKEGEKIAQNGRGLTFADKAGTSNGGNCYNCHQIDASEISHGTIGPSLHRYGKNLGSSEEALKNTWAKIYNAKAFNACSNMPRAGHQGILNETQIKHLMALLLDPKSPVNQ